jgi:MFS family permease
MAVLGAVRTRRDSDEREPGSRLLGSVWILAGVALLLLLGLGWNFLLDPTLSAPTRDPAWYTWRTELLMNAPPELIVQEWGPFGMFSGGYRVTVPLAGALLQRVAGVDGVTFSTLLMVAIPVLTSLVLGAFAYRHRRDPLLFFTTLIASGALFLATPYVGYLDNLLGLYLLALTLPFLAPARTSWGARSAVALFMMLATLTHPTTVAIYVIVLCALGGWHLLTHRFSIPKALFAYGPMLTAAGVGTVAGLAFWVGGLWGLSAPFADAALPPPYPLEVFRSTLGQWVLSLYPLVSGPLFAVALASIAARTVRRDGSTEEYDRMSLLWMLPFLGTLGFAAGLTYPYYRFMNTTLAVMLLVGMGTWVAARYLLRLRARAVGVAGMVLIVAALGFVFVDGLRGQWADTGPRARWFDPAYRVPLASVEAYAATQPEDRPIVFVNDYPPQRVAWGWGKTFANIARAGLASDQAERSVVYFGTVEDFLADRPSVAGEPTYDRVSRGFHEDAVERLAGYEEEPVAFLVAAFNPNTPNAELIADYTQIGPGVALIEAPGLAEPDPEAVEAATQAGRAAEAAVADPPGILSDPLHLLRVVGLLAFLLVVPGLIAARWFELEDGPVKLALVPGLSIGLLLASGTVVVAVTRSGFGAAQGWTTVALAVGVAVALALLARRREAGRQAVMPFVYRSLSLFSNRSFGFLMGAQFMALFGDGIVQGSLAKAIAFGGSAGFSLEEARSPRDIMALVLLTYLPYTLVSPFAGVLIDRYDRRRLLVFANGFRAVFILAVGVITVDRLGDAALIASLLLTLASTRLVLAIKSAGLPSVLGERNLMQGNAISQAGSALFQILGAGVAVVGTSVAPASALIVVGALVYGGGAFVASKVEHLAVERRTTRLSEEVRRVVRDIWEGLQEVRRRPGAGLGVFSFFALRFLTSFVALLFVLQVRDILGGDASKTSVYIAAATGALGAVLGFVLAQALKERMPPARLLVAAMTLAGGGIGVFGGFGGAVGLATVAFVAALAYFLGKVSVDTLVQQALADRYRGRGFSLFDVALNLAWIFPALILFLVWTEDNARVLTVVAGVAFLAVAFLVAGWARRIAPHLRPPEELPAGSTG